MVKNNKSLAELSQEELLAKAEEMQKSLEEKDKTISEQTTLLDELNEKLEAAKKGAATGKKVTIVKHGKEKYRVMIPKFNIPGIGIKTAEDLESDAGLVKTLLDMESSVLKKVEE